MTDRNLNRERVDNPTRDANTSSSKTDSRSGTEHEIRGEARQAEGNIQKNMGKATDDRSQQMKGAAKEAAGKVQEKFGETKRNH